MGATSTGGTKIRVQVIPVPAWTEIPGDLQFTDAAVDYER